VSNDPTARRPSQGVRLASAGTLDQTRSCP
jgi:hypothetical protein